MIALARPGALIRGGQQGIDLGTGQEFNQGPRETLAGDGQHTLNLCGVLRRLESCVAKERVNGGEAQIAGTNAHALTLLHVIQEGHDQGSIDLLEAQPRGRLVQPSLNEFQELAKGVAIRTDGVGARLALLHQALGKEALHQRSKAIEVAHGWSSQRCSSRRIASRINSGAPLRYHCVSSTCTWPR